MKFVDHTKEDFISNDQHEDCFYQEADALEDSILFPEDLGSKAHYKANRPAVERFCNKGPDWERFVNDWSTTDEEVEDSDDLDGDKLGLEKKDDHLLTEGAHANNSDRSDSDENSGTSTSWESLQESIEDSDEEGLDLADSFDEGVLTRLGEATRDILSTKGWKNPRLSKKENTEAELMTFLDREKSKRTC